ncbi:autotransporter domain-containing protein [Tardiphaga sp. 709]|uniref:autotransporter outer membrane beta-barrel domain-containing protein n=1 Tax=Tardiphaga sp. 709 TaxID=3076039 RepID=UPI0028E9E096|nr:autotransporter domain-containing protein [Tardiphaga sp. 709]WNV08592.1 autotransporter domain-containing protein [Tardiphaga sp. 709]
MKCRLGSKTLLQTALLLTGKHVANCPEAYGERSSPRAASAASKTIRPVTWLGSTALLASLAGTVVPSEALAACVGENTGSVTCDAANPATGGMLITSFAGTTVVTVNPGAQIDTGPASVTVTAPGSLTFTHSDTNFGIPQIVTLSNDFGDISYVGNAATNAVNAQGTTGTIDILNTAAIGTGGLAALTTGNGKIQINSNATVNGTIFGQSSGGDVFITGSGNVTSTTAGISATTVGVGNAIITYNGPITSADAALFASTFDGNATVTGSGSVTSADGAGTIKAWVAGNGPGNALIAWNGAVNNTAGGAGLYAIADLGTATVNVPGNVTSTNNAAVRASSGTGTATVTVANGLTLSGSFQNAIDVGSPFGNVNLVVGDGASISAIVDAIFAHTITGNTTATIGAGTVVSAAIGGGLVLQAPGGITTATIGAGAIISGEGGIGIDTGSGSLTIGNGASVTGTGGTGVSVQSKAGFTLFNAGIISGQTAAIHFAHFTPISDPMTLTLGPTSVIVGQVIGGASPFQIALGYVPGVADILQLGGTGAGTFDVSLVGDTAQYSGFGTFNKVDASNWTLTGTSTFAGPVNVSGGTLSVNGDITSAASLTVNAGGTLGGTGVVGTTAINGGTLAPGNSIGTLTVSGSLTMTAASTYLVQVSGTTSDRTNVTGLATISGKVIVDPLRPLGVTTTYTILNAGTRTGTFDSVSIDNFFARNARLSYVGNDVLLTLDPGLLGPILPGSAGTNQRTVAGAIDNAITGGAVLPSGFNALYLLSGNELLTRLSQASGETATGAQQTTFDAMTQFMGVMTDPFTAGRGTAQAGAAGYADETLAYAAKRAPSDALAAIYRKAPPMAPAFQARWNVWAAGFGGSRNTDGNTVVGSSDTRSSIGGVAVGADYWFSPNTLAGFSLAGGGTNFSVANGGSGRSDLFQAGAFVRHTVGSAYITAAAAYGWQDITTDRVVGGDRLRAQFNANSYSGRVEGGNRYLMSSLGGVGFTPYAAAQVTALDLPSYAETAGGGANTFALAYAGKTVTSTRSELGFRIDKSFAVTDAILTLRGRVAWAHDFNSDRYASATFQTLPGASFFVNGAAQASDAALTTASAEMKWTNGWTVAGTFEGEFSDVTRSYAGKGVVRYAW